MSLRQAWGEVLWYLYLRTLKYTFLSTSLYLYLNTSCTNIMYLYLSPISNVLKVLKVLKSTCTAISTLKYNEVL